MMFPIQPGRFLLAAALAAVAFPLAARADISGFGDFSNFAVNQSDTASSATFAPGIIHLTNSGVSEGRSVFANTPQTITQFTASFTYQATSKPTDGDFFGGAIVFQNNGAHTSAIGNLGYASSNFTKSAAISLEYSTVSSGSSSTGFYTGGNAGGGSAITIPVNIFSGDPINVSLSYSGSTLSETLVDATTHASFTTSYFANIPTAVGGSTAFVGFTANTRTFEDAADFSNFQFTTGAVPEPASLSVLGVFGVGLFRRRPR